MAPNKSKPGAGDAGLRGFCHAATADDTLIASPLLAVYDGQVCKGFILPRNKLGWEAFDADDRSLGLYADQQGAITAISEAAEVAP